MSAVRLHQVGGAVLATIFVDLGYRAWIAGSPHDRVLVLISIASYVLAFVAVRGMFAASRLWLVTIYPALCIAGLLIGMSALGLSTDIFHHYANDALAYDQYSAQVLLHGRNPYTTDMRPALDAFKVPAQDRTTTPSGSLVTVQSYPALAFLVYVPFVALNVHNLLWLNVAMLVVAVLVGYAYVPPESRIAVGLLVIVVQEFLYFVMGGGTDVMWVVPMIAVAALWESSLAWSAFWLAVACALKQDAWFVVPFALVHWWRAVDGSWRPFAGIVAILAGTFLVPNISFILWNAGAWAHGVFAPLSAHPIPLGVGFVQLLASHILPPALALAVLPWIAAFIVCLYAYVRYPKRCAWMPFIAPAVVLFFAPRSLVSYFLYWPMIAVVYALRWELPYDAPVERTS